MDAFHNRLPKRTLQRLKQSKGEINQFSNTKAGGSNTSFSVIGSYRKYTWM